MDINSLIQEYQTLHLEQVVDYEKFNIYFITNHSTVIEGSTLTDIETQLLLDENLTPKGKPLEHSLMTIDHHKALLFVLDLAKNKKAISTSLLQQINGKVMLSTGKIYNTALGQVDATKGDLRKFNVFVGKRYFPNYNKVSKHTKEFCIKLNNMIDEQQNDIIECMKTSFWAHFNLVSIHPFSDGNGRTARLLMNHVQQYFNLPLSIVFKEDKADYFDALEKSRNENDLSYFQGFMFEQYKKYLSIEIQKFRNKSQSFNFIV